MRSEVSYMHHGESCCVFLARTREEFESAVTNGADEVTREEYLRFAADYGQVVEDE